MITINSRAEFEAWSRKVPVSWPAAVAVRSALRSLPYLSFPKKIAEISSVIRCLSLARAATLNVRHAQVKAQEAAREVTSDVPMVFISMAAADATARVDGAAAATVDSAARPFKDSKVFWSSVESDVNWLDRQPRLLQDRKGNVRLGVDLSRLNLWPHGISVEFHGRVKKLCDRITQISSDLSVWADWYYIIATMGSDDFGYSSWVESRVYSDLVALDSEEWQYGIKYVSELTQISIFNAREKRPVEADRTDFQSEGSVILPSELPAQGHGPHYGLSNGRVVFAPKNVLDGNKNDISRLKSLYPVLKTLCSHAQRVFGRNFQHGDVADIISEYSRVLEHAIESVDFAQLAGLGLILGNIESAANREIEDRLRSEFEDDEKAVLKSLLDAHGPFILATEVGRELLADAERYRRNVDQEITFRRDGAELIEAARNEGIVGDREADFTRDLARDVGKGPAPERTAVFGQSALRNFSIAIIGGGAIGACAIMGKDLWDAGQPFFTFLGGGLGLTGVEALKKSKPFQETVKSLTSLLDKAGGFEGDEAEKYRKFAVLILKEESRLRRLAGEQREYAWLHEWLDWIKANYQP